MQLFASSLPGRYLDKRRTLPLARLQTNKKGAGNGGGRFSFLENQSKTNRRLVSGGVDKRANPTFDISRMVDANICHLRDRGKSSACPVTNKKGAGNWGGRFSFLENQSKRNRWLVSGRVDKRANLTFDISRMVSRVDKMQIFAISLPGGNIPLAWLQTNKKGRQWVRKVFI